MDLRGKKWADLTEAEKTSLDPDIREIMQKDPDVKLVGKKKKR